jgi:hypothetical protein
MGSPHLSLPRRLALKRAKVTYGKIKLYMENPTIGTGAPPRMMNAIIAGFNIVANNLALLVLPIVIDLYLWLGPQVKIGRAHV